MSMTRLCHTHIKQHLPEITNAIDATCGNGWDTLFLANGLRPQGNLFVFDLQKQAIEQTKKRLHLHTSASRISYFQESHTNMEMRISRSLHNCMDIIMYNLGYLPHGDKSITTLASTTLESFDQAYRLLRPLGWMSVLCYPGHPQGAIETQQVLTWIDNHQNHFELVEKSLGPTPSNLSPIFLLLRSRKTHSFVSDQLIC